VLVERPATRSAAAGAAAARRLHLPEERGGGRWCERGKGRGGESRSLAECASSHLPPITWPRRPRARLGGQSARRRREGRRPVGLRARGARVGRAACLRRACHRGRASHRLRRSGWWAKGQVQRKAAAYPDALSRGARPAARLSQIDRLRASAVAVGPLLECAAEGGCRACARRQWARG
jgi:hypothetical protein